MMRVNRTSRQDGRDDCTDATTNNFSHMKSKEIACATFRVFRQVFVSEHNELRCFFQFGFGAYPGVLCYYFGPLKLACVRRRRTLHEHAIGERAGVFFLEK